MRKTAFLLAAGTIAAASALTSALTSPTEHKLTAPQDVKWGAGPATLPPGAEAAVLYGDPTKEGLFAMRLKLPKGYRIAPHTHPKPEIVTVISGAFKVGLGVIADDAKATAMPAGSFISLSPGMAHFAGVDEDTVVQLNSTGPWSLTYVNPKDDPRQKPK